MPSRSATEPVALARDAPEYPASLRDLPDPPDPLFTRGARLPSAHRAVALVGSRAASPYGIAVAGRLAGDLARMGMVVVSGLARGIDAAAHRGALEAGGATVAVLPSGLDRITPVHHESLAWEIARRGTLITEHAAGGPRSAGEFVRRNRLIAGLCAATVVVEAAERSGALSTAAAARRLGRELLAVPGDIDRDTARGCHRLLREGATLCESAGEVARAVERWAAGRDDRAEPEAPPPPPESRLRAALAADPRPVEALAAAAGLPLAEALAGLLALEWAGVARSRPGQRWSRAEP